MFKFYEIITKEEQIIMRGIAKRTRLNKRDVNKQLIEARKLNK